MEKCHDSLVKYFGQLTPYYSEHLLKKAFFIFCLAPLGSELFVLNGLHDVFYVNFFSNLTQRTITVKIQLEIYQQNYGN